MNDNRTLANLAASSRPLGTALAHYCASAPLDHPRWHLAGRILNHNPRESMLFRAELRRVREFRIRAWA